ncbi:MAG: phosphoadenosine phosphosulfate reductase family protein [Proteobacteria bacterium]|nr:phosphoadenosine phosphosulfate reductase family protein [Pseudomonadota bacterium]
MQPSSITSCKRESLIVVSLSGGKDSTAVALLARQQHAAPDCRFVFADTGNEHEITLDYVHRYLPTIVGPIATVRADFSYEIEAKRQYARSIWPTEGVPEVFVERALSVLRPTGVPFLDLCLWKGRFPSRKAQFCTQHLKRIPLDQYLLDRMLEGYEVESWRGIRREESLNRRNAVERERVAEGFDIVQPIVTWSAQQVVDFVLAHGVALNPLYRQGMHRVGCLPCINCQKDELLEIAKRFPEHIDKIREWEHLVSMAAKRGWTTFFADSFLPGETIEQIAERMCIDARVRWAKTAHGGRQSDFLRESAPAACSSVYGLCD